MAEKRGQYAYLDDGTVAQLVQIAGADATGGAVNTTTTEIRAMDLQARLVNTAVTHTGALVSPSGGSSQASFVAVPDGMSEFVTNLTIDSAVANCYVDVEWSDDGTTVSGKSLVTLSNSIISISKTSPNWLAVGGLFYKARIQNNDAAPHTCNANIKFRA